MNNLIILADNPYVRAGAVFITIVASCITIYHLVQYQMPLAKINLEKAKAETQKT